MTAGSVRIFGLTPTDRSLLEKQEQLVSGMTSVINDFSAIQAHDKIIISPTSQNSFGKSKWQIENEKQRDDITKQVRDILGMNIRINPPI